MQEDEATAGTHAHFFEFALRSCASGSAFPTFCCRSRIVLTAASVQPADKTSDAEVTSLYQRLGGSDGIDAVVKLFYQKVYSDARVNKWFDGVSQAGQMKKMSRFVRFATGSGEEYGPKDLGRPHAKLVERGLQDEDYDAIVELFTEALAVSGFVDRGIMGMG